VEKMARFEISEQVDGKLSTALSDHHFQNLAYAMRVYVDLGNRAFITKS
jgi:hypothetical protein